MTFLHNKHLLDKLLTVGGKGWKLDLFVGDAIKRDELICNICNNICKNAVEFICKFQNAKDEHKENEILSYCECCIKQALAENGNKCLISGHPSPEYGASRGYRRMILRMKVFCPNSVQYSNQNRMESKKTSVEAQEGHLIENININGCTFKGSLSELIESHIQECIQQRIKSEYKSDNNSKNFQLLMIEDQHLKIQHITEELQFLKSEIISQKESTKNMMSFLENIRNEIQSIRMLSTINNNLKLISIRLFPCQKNSLLLVEWTPVKTYSKLVYNLEYKQFGSSEMHNIQLIEQKMDEEQIIEQQWHIFIKLSSDQCTQKIVDNNGIFQISKPYIFRISVLQKSSTMNDMCVYSNVFQASFHPPLHSLLLTNEESCNLCHMITNGHRYDYRLLFRGSRDGFSVGAFHSKCDFISPTITIVHSELGHIFGGFTPCKWGSSKGDILDSTKESFIFLLRTKREKDKPGIPFKFKIKDEENTSAIQSYVNEGVRFGKAGDFCLKNNCNSNKISFSTLGKSYNAPSDPNMLAGVNAFTVRDYEVWQLFLIYPIV